MYEENYKALANAIIRRLKNHPNDGLAQDTVREITKFFCSQYFEALTDLDGPALLNRIMREMDEKHGKN